MFFALTAFFLISVGGSIGSCMYFSFIFWREKKFKKIIFIIAWWLTVWTERTDATDRVGYCMLPIIIFF